MLQIDEEKFENISRTLQLLTTTEEELNPVEAAKILILFRKANNSVEKVYSKKHVNELQNYQIFCLSSPCCQQ